MSEPTSLPTPTPSPTPATAPAPAQASDWTPDPLPVTATRVEPRSLIQHLSTQQRIALSALIEGKSIKLAAKNAGVHRSTLHDWIKTDPYFRAAYDAWQQEAKESAKARLASLVDRALEAVGDALMDGDQRLAYKMLKDLGCVNQIAQGPANPTPAIQPIQVHLPKVDTPLAAPPQPAALPEPPPPTQPPAQTQK